MKVTAKWILVGILALVSACGGRNNSANNDGGITGSGDATVTATENTDYGGTTGPGVIYTFVGWDASTTTGSYPDQMSIRCTSTADPTIAASVSGTYTGHTNNSEIAFGARGHGLGGISVLSTGTANNICSYDGTNPGFISAIEVGPFNTTGVTGLRVFFEAAQISDQTREYGLRLQYSTDGGATFTDAPGPVEFTSTAAGSSTAYRQFGPVTIAAIDNQPNVILRWRYYFISGSSGNRTRIALRNIRVSNDATLPSAPTGLTATALSFNSIKLDWTHGTDNVTTASYMRYDIYQATTSGGQNFSNPPQYTIRGTNTATLSGLNSSTTYYFVVRSRDEQGNRETNTIEVSATTPADTTPPTVISSNPANGATNIGFNPSASVTFSQAMNVTSVNSAYTVRETNCSGAVISSGTPTASGGDSVFTYNLSGLTPNATYAICVTTAAQSAASVPIASAFSATFTTAVLAEPTAVTFTPGNMQVTIGWTNSANANAGVKIVRATGSAPADCNSGTTVCTGSGCNANLTPGASGRTYVDTGLTNGTTYHYRVCANHTGPATLSAGVIGSATPNDAFNVNSATSTSNTTVNVVFSHAPTPGGGATGAENASNYKIVLGSGSCTDAAAIGVSAASLSGMTVTLTTASQSAISYRVCVSNVTRNSDSATLSTNSATFTGTGSGPTLIYSENFEGCTKAAYAAGAPTGCTSGNSWNMDDVLIGTTMGSDRFNGARSARFNSTNVNSNASNCNSEGGMCLEMTTNVAGATEVRFYCAKYGTDTNDGIIQLQASTDGGATWTNQGATVTCTGATLLQYTRSVSFSSTPVRFRWVKTNSASTSRTNIDDIEIYH